MKKLFFRTVSVLMVVLMILTSVPLGGLTAINVKAEGADYQNLKNYKNAFINNYYLGNSDCFDTGSNDLNKINSLMRLSVGNVNESLHYAYVDLSQDNKPELFIAIKNKDRDSYNIVDILGYENNRVKRLFDLYSMGERSTYSICEGNIIRCRGSGSAFYSEERLYTLPKNTASPKIKEKIIYDNGTYKSEKNGKITSLTKGQYDAAIAGYKTDSDVDWELLCRSRVYESNFSIKNGGTTVSGLHQLSLTDVSNGEATMYYKQVGGTSGYPQYVVGSSFKVKTDGSAIKVKWIDAAGTAYNGEVSYRKDSIVLSFKTTSQSAKVKECTKITLYPRDNEEPLENDAAGLDGWTVENFNEDRYVADIFSNRSGDIEVINNLIKTFSDEALSPCGHMIDILYGDINVYMGIKDWELVTMLEKPSKVFGNIMSEDDYCEYVIFEALNVMLGDDEVTAFLNNGFVNTGSDLVSGLSDVLGVSVDVLMSEGFKFKSDKYNDSIKQYFNNRIFDRLGDAGDIVGKVFDYADSLKKMIETISAYMLIAQLEDSLKNCLREIYDICPVINLPMKSALSEVYRSCDGLLGAAGVALQELNETGAEIAITKIAEFGFKGVVSAHPLIKAFFTGISLGKATADALFATSDMYEQIHVMKKMSEFEELVKKCVKNFEEDYKKSPTAENAANYRKSVQLFFKTIADVNIDCTIKLYDNLYNAGLVNFIKNGFGKFDSAADVKVTLTEMKNNRNYAYEMINSFWREYLYARYPDIYNAYGYSSKNVPVKSITINHSFDKAVDIYVGESITLPISFKPVDSSEKIFELESSNPSVLEVHGTTITGIAPGTVKLIIYSPLNPGIGTVYDVTVGEVPAKKDEQLLSNYLRKEWLIKDRDGCGVFSAVIKDFDNDGSAEMLTFEDTPGVWIYMSLYAVVNNKVVLTDKYNIYTGFPSAGGDSWLNNICAVLDDGVIKTFRNDYLYDGGVVQKNCEAYSVVNDKFVKKSSFSLSDNRGTFTYENKLTGKKYSSYTAYNDAVIQAGFGESSHDHFDKRNQEFDANTDNYEIAECFKGNHIFSFVYSRRYLTSGFNYTFIHNNTNMFGKPDNLIANSNLTSTKLTWDVVPVADGYKVYQKTSNGWQALGTTTDVTATLKNLEPGTVYTFAVKAGRILNGKTVWADTYSTIDTVTMPAAPKIEKLTTTKSSVVFDWAPSAGATGYRVYVDYGTGWKPYIKHITETACALVNLKENAKFKLAVRAYTKTNSGIVWGGYSKADVVVTDKPIPPSKAPAPTAVTAAQNISAIKLSWNACKGATGYRIYYKSGNTWKVCVSSTTATSHTFSGLKAGAKYTFAIRPYIIFNDEVIWSDYTQFTTATKPATVTAKATSPSEGKINLTWNAVAGADGYQVYYKTGNGTYKLYKVCTTVQNFAFENLKSGTKYTFAVRAGIRTSGGNIFGGYKEVPVTVK